MASFFMPGIGAPEEVHGGLSDPRGSVRCMHLSVVVEPTVCRRFACRAGETVLVEVVRGLQARMKRLLSKL